MLLDVDLKCTLTQIQLELFKRYELYNEMGGQLYKDILADEINEIMQIGQDRLLIAPKAEIDAYKTFKTMKSWRYQPYLKASNMLGCMPLRDIKLWII